MDQLNRWGKNPDYYFGAVTAGSVVVKVAGLYRVSLKTTLYWSGDSYKSITHEFIQIAKDEAVVGFVHYPDTASHITGCKTGSDYQFIGYESRATGTITSLTQIITLEYLGP